MEFTTAFFIYATIFRLGIIVSGTVCIVLGYRLFCQGVFPGGRSKKLTELQLKLWEAKFTVKNAAPGTCFAVVGFLMIAVVFWNAYPQLNLQAALIDSNGNKQLTELRLRGAGDNTLPALIEQGIRFEAERDTSRAVAAYRQAVETIAAPMNHLAWLYQARGDFELAKPLSRHAVELAPDNADFLDTLAETLYKNGEHDEAVRVMEKAAQSDPLNYRLKLDRMRRGEL